ncbi:MAG: MlaD family protein [Candidatus Gastranaerophilales bacterium]|nr:MlaD family protein [Candidatus Gastranaerophilales bacterium]MCM1073994.1 MlaD family protein [Bacteroides sp.]
MTGKDKESNVFYITHSGELLFWLVVVLIVVAITTVTYMVKEKNADNDYRVFLPDVDGLIVGSPVRMMGIEVGHVVKIKPIKDEVYVKFILTNPDVYIPQGTAVTVEFSGMAGSRSLELYLPDENTYVDEKSPLITVMPPKRLHDSLGLLNDMFKKIDEIIYTSTSFGKKLNLDLPETGKSADMSGFLKYSNDMIDDTEAKAAEFRKFLGGKHE